MNLIKRFRPGVSAGLALAVSLFSLAAQDAPQFTDVLAQTNAEMLLRFTAAAGLTYRIDESADLRQWFPLYTLRGAISNQYTDSGAPFDAARYYRAVQLADTNSLTGDHLPTADGDVVIHPINHASFVMTWEGKTIYNDPVGGAARYAGLPRADLILVSHDHGDHYDSATLTAVKGTNTVILAPKAVYSSLPAGLKAIATVMTNNASTNLLGLTVDAIPAYNLTQSYHPKGVGNGYVVTLGGKRIYISGDTEDIPEMRALQNIDVAFVCVLLPYTMSVPKAVSAVREFRPRIVFPYHTFVSGSPTTDLTALKRQIGTDLGIEVRRRKWY